MTTGLLTTCSCGSESIMVVSTKQGFRNIWPAPSYWIYPCSFTSQWMERGQINEGRGCSEFSRLVFYSEAAGRIPVAMLARCLLVDMHVYGPLPHIKLCRVPTTYACARNGAFHPMIVQQDAHTRPYVMLQRTPTVQYPCPRQLTKSYLAHLSLGYYCSSCKVKQLLVASR
jgi:hypothetical protein